MITIFTPTYNRAYVLPKLYHSLCEQTSTDFEWVIVDDGSTDNTITIVQSWIKENKIRIRYFYQENSGKPAAHNRGVKEAMGDLFTCVDSDDYLTNLAVETIIETWNKHQNDTIIGVLAFRKRTDNTPITMLKNNRVQSTTLRNAYKLYGLSGDTMLIYKTDVIRKFEFPCINGEKFIPEGYLYNKLDQIGELEVLRECLYVCEYLEDGYTHNVAKNIFDNYKGYVIHINERLKTVDRGFDKLLDSIRYDSIMIAHYEKNIVKNAVYPTLAFIGLMPAYVIAYKRYRQFMKK